MIKNYLKVALRSLQRQKGLTFINVFGLSTGLACFVLFMLYAVNEFSFDRFNKNAANIYRTYLQREATANNAASASAYMPMPLAAAMQRDLPGVESTVRFKQSFDESFIKFGNQVIREHISFAGPKFFSMFSFPLINGNPASALSDIHNVVLGENTARKLFGNTDVVGKTLQIKINDDFEAFTISGVAKEVPSNSTITFNVLADFDYVEASDKRSANNWNRSGYQTFVQLKPGSSLPGDKETMIAFRKKYYPEEDKQDRANGWTAKGPARHFAFQPLLTMHTNTKISGAGVTPVDPKSIWMVLAIAGGILLIACINFTTLAIGRSAGRAKEVGVRKVIGGSKKTIMHQFLTEAFLLTIISATLAFVLLNDRKLKSFATPITTGVCLTSSV